MEKEDLNELLFKAAKENDLEQAELLIERETVYKMFKQAQKENREAIVKAFAPPYHYNKALEHFIIQELGRAQSIDGILESGYNGHWIEIKKETENIYYYEPNLYGDCDDGDDIGTLDDFFAEALTLEKVIKAFCKINISNYERCDDDEKKYMHIDYTCNLIKDSNWDIVKTLEQQSEFTQVTINKYWLNKNKNKIK